MKQDKAYDPTSSCRRHGGYQSMTRRPSWHKAAKVFLNLIILQMFSNVMHDILLHIMVHERPHCGNVPKQVVESETDLELV